MIFGNGWHGTFIDDRQTVVLTKPGQNPVRRIYMKYSFPFMKRVDAHGNFVNDHINPIDDPTRRELLVACQKRWPGE